MTLYLKSGRPTYKTVRGYLCSEFERRIMSNNRTVTTETAHEIIDRIRDVLNVMLAQLAIEGSIISQDETFEIGLARLRQGALTEQTKQGAGRLRSLAEDTNIPDRLPC